MLKYHAFHFFHFARLFTNICVYVNVKFFRRRGGFFIEIRISNYHKGKRRCQCYSVCYLGMVPSWRPVIRKYLEFTFVKMYGALSFGHKSLSNISGSPCSVLFPTGSSILFHSKFAPKTKPCYIYMYSKQETDTRCAASLSDNPWLLINLSYKKTN